MPKAGATRAWDSLFSVDFSCSPSQTSKSSECSTTGTFLPDASILPLPCILWMRKSPYPVARAPDFNNCLAPRPGTLSGWRPSRKVYMPSLKSLLKLPLTAAIAASLALPVISQEPDQTPALKKTVNLVNLFATVRDKNKRIVGDLKQDDFKVFEDNQEQKLAFFSKEVTMPITLGLLIDTSGSEQYRLGAEQEAASRFMERVMRKGDEAMVISFDLDVDLLADFTDDRMQVERAIHKARIGAVSGGVVTPGTIPTSSGSGGTHFYDAIFLACRVRVRRSAILRSRRCARDPRPGVDGGRRGTRDAGRARERVFRRSGHGRPESDWPLASLLINAQTGRRVVVSHRRCRARSRRERQWGRLRPIPRLSSGAAAGDGAASSRHSRSRRSAAFRGASLRARAGDRSRAARDRSETAAPSGGDPKRVLVGAPGRLHRGDPDAVARRCLCGDGLRRRQADAGDRHTRRARRAAAARPDHLQAPARSDFAGHWRWCNPGPRGREQ